jgi:hypothetical protein
MPGYAVQQQYCRAPIRTGSAMQRTQDPAPAGGKDDTVEAGGLVYGLTPTAAANACSARR